MLASIVIRTLNESRHLDDLLSAIKRQQSSCLRHEIILVDSGSTDGTLDIAKRHGCHIHHIKRSEFSFGRSLNLGCENSSGDILVFISGHCVPVDVNWLDKLCRPIVDNQVAYSYGRQIGDDDNNFSERRIFAKYFPGESSIPQVGYYCNNANSALKRSVWESCQFNEELTGLEDMELARRLVLAGEKIGYVADACVFHHHNEDWATVRRRFEREAIALQRIMPEVHLSLIDVLRYIACSVWMDWRSAVRHSQFRRCWLQIAQYRFMQYVGSYRGNHEHRKLSQKQKDVFFYPSTTKEDDLNGWLHPHRRAAPNEGEQ